MERKRIFIIAIPYLIAFLLIFLILRADACHSPCFPEAICPLSYALKATFLYFPLILAFILIPSLILSLILSFVISLLIKSKEKKLIFLKTFLIFSYIFVLLISILQHGHWRIISGICGSEPSSERVIINPDTGEIIRN